MPVFFPQVLQRNPRPQPCVEIGSLGNYETFNKACLREQEPKDLFLVVAIVHIGNHFPIFAREEALLVVLINLRSLAEMTGPAISENFNSCGFSESKIVFSSRPQMPPSGSVVRSLLWLKA